MCKCKYAINLKITIHNELKKLNIRLPENKITINIRKASYILLHACHDTFSENTCINDSVYIYIII